MGYQNAALANDTRKTSGAPTNGTSEVQTLTIGGTPTGGTFKLKYKHQVTAAITWSSTNNTLRDRVDAALEALTNIGAGNVAAAVGTMTAGVGTLTITFGGALAKLAVPTIEVADNSLTGSSPTVAVVETTPGVTATERGAPTGTRLIRTDTGVEYVNTGTASAPTWTQQTTPSAEMQALEAAIPTAAVADLVDNSGGATADGTLAADAAIGVLTIPISLAQLANADLLTTWTPGFKGTIKKITAVVKVPATTAAKAATLTTKIGSTALTGGVLSLTSANMTPLGKATDATAITAANVFSASDTISIVASAVTAFVEGEAYLLISYASDVVDDNTKDLAAKVNDLLAKLRTAGIVTP